MLITREIDYALRILRRLSDDKLHVMRDLCEEEIIPQKFAYKILRKLKKAALIKATRGGGGGVCLATDLRALNLYDVIHAVDAETNISACTRYNYHCEWCDAKHSHCNMHMQLLHIEEIVNQELRKTNLYEFLIQPERPCSIA